MRLGSKDTQLCFIAWEPVFFRVSIGGRVQSSEASYTNFKEGLSPLVRIHHPNILTNG